VWQNIQGQFRHTTTGVLYVSLIRCALSWSGLWATVLCDVVGTVLQVDSQWRTVYRSQITRWKVSGITYMCSQYHVLCHVMLHWLTAIDSNTPIQLMYNHPMECIPIVSRARGYLERQRCVWLWGKEEYCIFNLPSLKSLLLWASTPYMVVLSSPAHSIVMLQTLELVKHRDWFRHQRWTGPVGYCQPPNMALVCFQCTSRDDVELSVSDCQWPLVTL